MGTSWNFSANLFCTRQRTVSPIRQKFALLISKRNFDDQRIVRFQQLSTSIGRILSARLERRRGAREKRPSAPTTRTTVMRSKQAPSGAASSQISMKSASSPTSCWLSTVRTNAAAIFFFFSSPHCSKWRGEMRTLDIRVCTCFDNSYF